MFSKFAKIFKLITLVAVLLCLGSSLSFAAGINSVRVGQGVGSVRIVFDSDQKFDYKVFLLNSPQRLVVDTDNVDISSQIEKYDAKNNMVSKARLGSAGVGGKRIVFNLYKPAIIKKVFMLPPQSSFGWRFVIDLSICSDREFLSKVGSDYAFSGDS